MRPQQTQQARIERLHLAGGRVPGLTVERHDRRAVAATRALGAAGGVVEGGARVVVLVVEPSVVAALGAHGFVEVAFDEKTQPRQARPRRRVRDARAHGAIAGEETDGNGRVGAGERGLGRPVHRSGDDDTRQAAERESPGGAGAAADQQGGSVVADACVVSAVDVQHLAVDHHGRIVEGSSSPPTARTTNRVMRRSRLRSPGASDCS